MDARISQMRAEIHRAGGSVVAADVIEAAASYS
jgi:hypothetical protein